MADSPAGRSRHVELTLVQVIELQPGLGRLTEAFLSGATRAVEGAPTARDSSRFEQAYRNGIEIVNRFHKVTGHREICWRLPDPPPEDLDLGPDLAEAQGSL